MHQKVKHNEENTAKTPLNIAVLTVSDTRTPETDHSGNYLKEALLKDGHLCVDHKIVKDHKYEIRAVLSAWIFSPEVEVILITGGTGFSGRDTTPEAVLPLLDKEMPGFGELFRQVSYQEIHSSTIQSRAFAGSANYTIIFGLPGSTHACQTGWQQIIQSQLDSRFAPCNFVNLVKRKYG